MVSDVLVVFCCILRYLGRLTTLELMPTSFPSFQLDYSTGRIEKRREGRRQGEEGKGGKVSVFLFVTAPLWVSNVRGDRASHTSKSDD